jgi:hypothetical protein
MMIVWFHDLADHIAEQNSIGMLCSLAITHVILFRQLKIPVDVVESTTVMPIVVTTKENQRLEVSHFVFSMGVFCLCVMRLSMFEIYLNMKWASL